MNATVALCLAVALSGAPAPAVPPAALGEEPAPAAEPAPPEHEPSPVEATEEAPIHRHVASWILLGLGGVGLVTGGAFNLAAATSANTTPTAIQTGTATPTPQSNGLWTGAIVSYSLGALLGIGGAVAYYLEGRTKTGASPGR